MNPSDTTTFIIDLNEIEDDDITLISRDFTVELGTMVLVNVNVNVGDSVRVHNPDDDTLYWSEVVEKVSDRDFRVRILWDTCAPVLNSAWSAATVAYNAGTDSGLPDRDLRDVGVLMDDLPDEDEDLCGYSYDHDTEYTYEGEDGVQWVCRKCGAEGWEEPE